MLKMKPSKKLIYLDHAATTPVRSEVLRAIQPFFSENFGNPSSLYKLGVEAKEALESARKTIADILFARPKEVVFTAGGTESVNLAILGVAKAHSISSPKLGEARRGKKTQKRGKTSGHIITTKIEHHAVLNACKALEEQGFEVTYLTPDRQGFVNPTDVQKAIRKDTFLVSIMYTNNEIGSIQPIGQIGSIIRRENQRRSSLHPIPSTLYPHILFHSDACQASGFLNLNIQKLGVDLFSINASKIYGPKQVGALFVRSGVKLEPLVFGGEQEKNLRSGTENVAGAVGFAKALELAQQEKEKESEKLVKLRDAFAKQVLRKIPKSTLNGPSLFSPPTLGGVRGGIQKHGIATLGRLPNNLNFTFKGAEGEAVKLYLDALNIAVSTGSACASESLDPSHVLKAIGLSDNDAKDSIRITLGKTTTKEQLDFVVKALVEVVKLVRKM